MESLGPLSVRLPLHRNEGGHDASERTPTPGPARTRESGAKSVPHPGSSPASEQTRAFTGPRGPERAGSAEEAALSGSVRTQTEEAAAHEDLEALREAATALEEQLSELGQHALEISYDEDIARYVVRILDGQTREEIRQIPPERVLEASRRLGEIRGLLFDEKS